MTLQELQQKRIKLAAEIRALAVTQAEWTATDKANWDDACEQYDVTAAALDRAKVEANGQRPRNPRIGRDGGVVDGLDHNGNGARNRASDLDIVLSAWVRNQAGMPLDDADFEAAKRVGQSPLSAGLVLDLGLSGPVLGRDWNPSQTRNALSSQSAADGGALVPSGVLGRLELGLKQFGTMLNTSELIVTSDGRPMAWPTCDDTSNEGVQVGENAESFEDTSLTFGAKSWGAYKFSSQIVKVPHELLRDNAANLANALGDILGERLGRIVNRRATVGTGAVTINGIVNAAPVGKTTTSTTSISFDEIIDLVHSVDSAYRSSMTGTVGFQMNDLVAASVRKLKNGNGDYLWMDSVQAGMPPMLLGFPVYINSAMTDTLSASAKPIVFGDLSKFKLRLVNGVRLRQLNERYAENDQVGFLAFLEADGNLLKASDATSPVKVLQMAAA